MPRRWSVMAPAVGEANEANNGRDPTRSLFSRRKRTQACWMRRSAEIRGVRSCFLADVGDLRFVEMILWVQFLKMFLAYNILKSPHSVAKLPISIFAEIPTILIYFPVCIFWNRFVDFFAGCIPKVISLRVFDSWLIPEKMLVNDDLPNLLFAPPNTSDYNNLESIHSLFSQL